MDTLPSVPDGWRISQGDDKLFLPGIQHCPTFDLYNNHIGYVTTGTRGEVADFLLRYVGALEEATASEEPWPHHAAKRAARIKQHELRIGLFKAAMVFWADEAIAAGFALDDRMVLGRQGRPLGRYKAAKHDLEYSMSIVESAKNGSGG